MSNEARMAMYLDESPKQIRDLASALVSASSDFIQDDQKLKRFVNKAFTLIKPNLKGTIEGIEDYKIVDQYDLRLDEKRRVAHFAVRMRDCESAIEANGGENLYEGETQQRLQKQLQELFGAKLRVCAVRLQILPPKGLESWLWSDEEPGDLTAERISVEDAVKKDAVESESGLIPQNGTLHKLCIKWNISDILFWDGYYFGPSPGLACAVEHVLKKLPSSSKVYDPFAGVFLTQAICDEYRIHCESYDIKPGEAHKNSKANAFQKDFTENEFNLIVIDPIYSDLFIYLDKYLGKFKNLVKPDYLVVQCGDTQDVAWNMAVEKVLSHFGKKDIGISADASIYGTHVVVYKRYPR